MSGEFDIKKALAEQANQTKGLNKDEWGASHLKDSKIFAMLKEVKMCIDPFPYELQNLHNERVSKFFEGAGNLGTVTIIGLGGGGEIALHMLRSGVVSLNLIDCDILDPGNLVRHICGNNHILKNKAEAVKSVLDEYSGWHQDSIKAFSWNIFDEHKQFDDIIASSDAVVVATDNDSSKFYANEVCKKYDVPSIFVGMYEDGCGGEVFTSLPNYGCYECATHFQGRIDYLTSYMESASKKDCSSKRDAKAMPGLGIDQSFLCAIAARKCLDILVSKSGGKSLPPVGKNLIIWSLFGIPGITDSHLSSIHLTIEKHPNCSLCNP
ncbi:MAG: hypothetical protein ACD_2C00086G0002 [uncultured bacterium (gcode 4)]|uniref:THIF-type NAD/FAD binding fold domain-containing protein n=1 Tax=uncultured bacterium (gcode 4) TaxID=1234023 RepID=K2FF84_9BACT|nr:MAG: hypothetical protein ACD_2C00086G0002 [uncultured bacterium (gcode 4)]